MATIEIEAKSIEEATLKALDQLNCNKEDLSIELLEESTGLFGLGRKVKVRATAQDIVKDSYAVNEGDGKDQIGEWAKNPDFDARDALERICCTIVPDATVTSEDTGRSLKLTIDGDGSGIFIGRKGQTLEALQFVINKMNMKQTGRGVHIIVDSEGYFSRKTDELRHQAIALAEKVLATGQMQSIGPLNPQDRKIVHTTLQEKQGVTTRSIGKDSYKRVQILPTR